MTIEIPLPHWYHGELATAPTALDTLDQRMELVLRFARLNVEHDSGGPFAAAVFEETSGRLVSVGVNRVVPTACSSAHAEIVALTLAQQKLGSYDLGATGLPAHQLVVNWRPCAMCYGALPWSGNAGWDEIKPPSSTAASEVPVSSVESPQASAPD